MQIPKVSKQLPSLMHHARDARLHSPCQETSLSVVVVVSGLVTPCHGPHIIHQLAQQLQGCGGIARLNGNGQCLQEAKERAGEAETGQFDGSSIKYHHDKCQFDGLSIIRTCVDCCMRCGSVTALAWSERMQSASQALMH